MEHRDLQGVLIEVGDKVVYYSGYSGRADLDVGYVTQLCPKKVRVSYSAIVAAILNKPCGSVKNPDQLCIIEKGEAQ